MRRLPVLLIALLAAALPLLPTAARARPAPKRLAVLVGVNKYNRPGFEPALRFAERDMTALRDVFVAAGFKVTLLLGSSEGDNEATRANVRRALLDKTRDIFTDVTQDDTVLVAFSGHGQQVPVKVGDAEVETPFFCPKDAVSGDPDTLVSINEILDALDRRGGGSNLVLVDACRNFTARVGGQKKDASMDRSKVQSLREGIGVMFACSDRQYAQEHEEAGDGHGLFFYSLLQAIESEKKSGRVTWESLVPKIRTSVKELGDKLDATTPERQRQRPQYIGNFSGDPVLIDGVVAAEKVMPLKPLPDEPKVAESYDLTGGYRFAHFGKDERVRALVRVNDHETKRHEVYVADPATGKVLARPMVHPNSVYHASLSPDGRRVVTASADRTAVIRDAATGKMTTWPLEHDSIVLHAAFSPNGKQVVTSSMDKTAAVWDAATGKMTAGPMKHADMVNHASFSSDGVWVVTASSDQTARVWNAETGVPISEPIHHDAAVTHAEFSGDGLFVVTCSKKFARVWGADGKPVGEPMPHDEEVTLATFSPDGWKVVTQSGRTATLWDYPTAKKLGSATVK